ncbi:DNA adenine methylase [Acutalibacter muris]
MKYVGSKSRIAKHIVPIIQSYIDKTDANFYLEPFIGGGKCN